MQFADRIISRIKITSPCSLNAYSKKDAAPKGAPQEPVFAISKPEYQSFSSGNEAPFLDAPPSR